MTSSSMKRKFRSTDFKHIPNSTMVAGSNPVQDTRKITGRSAIPRIVHWAPLTNTERKLFQGPGQLDGSASREAAYIVEPISMPEPTMVDVFLEWFIYQSDVPDFPLIPYGSCQW